VNVHLEEKVHELDPAPHAISLREGVSGFSTRENLPEGPKKSQDKNLSVSQSFQERVQMQGGSTRRTTFEIDLSTARFQAKSEVVLWDCRTTATSETSWGKWCGSAGEVMTKLRRPNCSVGEHLQLKTTVDKHETARKKKGSQRRDQKRSLEQKFHGMAHNTLERDQENKNVKA